MGLPKVSPRDAQQALRSKHPPTAETASLRAGRFAARSIHLRFMLHVYVVRVQVNNSEFVIIIALSHVPRPTACCPAS